MRASDRKILGELDPRLRPGVESILVHVNASGKLPDGWELRVYCGYRSAEAQLAAFRAGNTKLKRGAHNYRPARACDLVWWHPQEGWSWAAARPWWLLGFWARRAGLTWGGDWGLPAAVRREPPGPGRRVGWDAPHCELPNWWRRAVAKVTGRR